MRLIDSSIKFPVSVIVAVLLACLFGLLGLLRVPIQMIPTIDRPEITVQTPYPGAGPIEVEEELTNRQEELLNTVENLRELTSVSAENQSTITLKYDWGINKDVARLDVSEKLAAVRNLPSDAEEPIIRAVNSDTTQPISYIVLLRDGDLNEFRPVAEDVIKAQIERVKGVGEVRFFGGEEYELQVDVDLSQLAMRGLTISDLRNALFRENRNIKAGSFDEGKMRHAVRTLGRYRRIEDVEQTIISRDAVGPVRVRDVARVRLTPEEARFIVRTNGQPALVYAVTRKGGSNTLEVMTGVRSVIDRMNARYASQGVELRIVYDATDYIYESIRLVVTNLLIGAALATAVLLFFLRSRSAVLVLGIAIPISVITTFFFIWVLDRSLNIISLAGLTFATGMVLDNAIVVVENIFRQRELGKGTFRAAYDGAREVWGAILASTLTTLAVFIPIILIEDEAGQIFRDIAIAISIAVALSLIVAITVIPMVGARLLGSPPRTSEDRLDARLARWLTTTLKWILVTPRRKASVIGGILAASLLVTALAMPDIDYLPAGNRNLLFVFMRVPPGNNLEQNERLVRYVEERILPMPEVKRMFSVVLIGRCFFGVVLNDDHSDKASIQAFKDTLKPQIENVPGSRPFISQARLIRGSGIGRGNLKILIEGDDLARMQEIADAAQDAIRDVEGVGFVNPTFELGKPEFVVEVDRVRAAEVGLTVQEVGMVVEMAVNGILSGTFDQDGREIDLRVQVPRENISSKEDLEQVFLHTPSGDTVQLADLTRIVARSGPTQVEHTDMNRTVNLAVNTEDEAALAKVVGDLEVALDPVRAALPLGYSLRVAGQADDLERTWLAFRGALLFALVITFLLLASLFESFLLPVVIMVSVPFAASGGVLALRVLHLFDATVKLDTITMLGFVILLGVVVNNAILLVHQTLNRLSEGAEPTDALLDAVRSRVRPILMTMVTTVFGMSPLVFASGAGSELYRGLGAILVGGLILSTLFTLLLVPTVLSFAIQRVEVTEGEGAATPS
ncbi:MAG: efflux RND transporter permease subunit [Deltaproteobacteria bacterium]|nr:efflux RND transporter permease subunit [Deltaproteobacteria bacterium]